ncbi:ATP-dependent RNA helicase DBP2-like protein isoform X2 [Tanacetum coccineum]
MLIWRLGDAGIMNMLEKSLDWLSLIMGYTHGGSGSESVATDVASRGLDVTTVAHVVNLDILKVAFYLVEMMRRVEGCHYQEACLSLTSSRISIFTVNTEKYHLDVLARSQGLWLGTLCTACGNFKVFNKVCFDIVSDEDFLLISLWLLDRLCNFGFSNRRLEQTATYSISTISE